MHVTVYKHQDSPQLCTHCGSNPGVVNGGAGFWETNVPMDAGSVFRWDPGLAGTASTYPTARASSDFFPQVSSFLRV